MAGGKTLASSEEEMIPVQEEGTTGDQKGTLGSKGLTRTATFFKEIPQLIPIGELSSAHQLVKELFCKLKIPTVPLAGRLVHFLGSWKKLTKDQNILQIVKGYRIPFLCKPKQKEPKEINFSVQEKATISLEVENLLIKGDVEQVCPQKDQFLSNICFHISMAL